ncbi:MAG TPA: PAS domain S-box protein, partial [Gemmata sp.]
LAVRESEERLRAVVESATDAIITADRSGAVLGWNSGAERMFGYPVREALGMNLGGVLPGYVTSGTAVVDPAASDSGVTIFRTGLVTSEGLRRNGNPFPVELSGTTWGAGSDSFFTVIVRDATERTRALEAIARSERYYRTLFENAHDPILVIDPDGEQVLDVNAEACRVYGFPRDEFIGRSLVDQSAEPARGHEHVARTTDGRTSHRFETVQFRSDGGRLDLEVNASVIEFQGRAAILSINRDVTDRKRAESRAALQASVSRSLAEANSFTQGAGDVLRAVCENTGWAVGEFWTIPPGERALRSVAVWHAPAATEFAAASRNMTFVPDEGLPGRVWTTGHPERVPDLAAAESVPRAALALGCGLGAALALPVHAEGQTVGVLMFVFAGPQPDRHLWRLLLGLGNQMGLFTERKRAKAALMERAQATAARASVAAAVATGGETRAVLRGCCEGLVRELETSFARVWTLAEREPVLELLASAGLYTHTDGPHGRVPLGRFKIGRIAERGQAHISNNLPEDSQIGDQEWVRREGLVAFAGFPLLIEGRVVGVLATFARAPIRPAACDALADAADLMAQFVERRRAEEAMRLRDRAIASFAQGVAIADATRPDNPLVYVNPGFETMTGYSAAEALGRNCRFLQGKNTDPAAVAAVRTGMREGRPVLVELLNYRKNGSTFWNALSVAPIRDGEGRLTHFVAMQADVSPFKKLEAQLLQSQKMEAVGHLAGGIAHDFNNLLTIIDGFATMALEDLPPGAPAREQLEEVLAAGNRAADLTRQLLAFSRQQVLQFRPVALNDLVSGVRKMLSRVIGEDVRLSTVLHPAVGIVRVDPGQMEQVLLNLAVNARDAMPTGGLLTIETMPVELDAAYTADRPEVQPGRYSLLAVTDTGSGMTEDVKARIFEPFFTTKDVGKGTGLGLATVFGIVKQSGGHIAVYSEVGRGTAFKVYLPEVRSESSAAVAQRPPVPTGRETVLLVEDENKVRALAGAALRRAGYEVLEAAGAEEAERFIVGRAQPVDLLLTDVVMPVTSGRVLAERLKGIAPALRVLFMSGYTDDAVVRHGLLVAEIEFLQKPFTLDALLRKVREVLDKSDPQVCPRK